MLVCQQSRFVEKQTWIIGLLLQLLDKHVPHSNEVNSFLRLLVSIIAAKVLEQETIFDTCDFERQSVVVGGVVEQEIHSVLVKCLRITSKLNH